MVPQPSRNAVDALPCDAQETGVPYDAAIERPFWDIFAPPFDMGSEPWQAARDVAARAGEFVVRGCTVRGALQMGQFTLAFRRARNLASYECGLQRCLGSKMPRL